MISALQSLRQTRITAVNTNINRKIKIEKKTLFFTQLIFVIKITENILIVMYVFSQTFLLQHVDLMRTSNWSNSLLMINSLDLFFTLGEKRSK